MAQGEPTELQRPKNAVVQEVEASEAGSDRPLGSFLTIMACALTASVALAALMRRAGRPRPERIRYFGECPVEWWD